MQMELMMSYQISTRRGRGRKKEFKVSVKNFDVRKRVWRGELSEWSERVDSGVSLGLKKVIVAFTGAIEKSPSFDRMMAYDAFTEAPFPKVIVKFPPHWRAGSLESTINQGESLPGDGKQLTFHECSSKTSVEAVKISFSSVCTTCFQQKREQFELPSLSMLVSRWTVHKKLVYCRLKYGFTMARVRTFWNLF